VGDVIATAFGVLALLGLALVGVGAARGARLPLVAGTGLLLALAAAWVVGLPGAALGLVALAFSREAMALARLTSPPTGPLRWRAATARAGWSSPASPPS
jgi:hypothetical protein